MKNSNYMDRAMKSSDPRFARVLGKIGYKTRDMRAADEVAAPVTQSTSQDEDRAELRKQYKAVVGKNPFGGWDAETLRTKIAEASLTNEERD